MGVIDSIRNGASRGLRSAGGDYVAVGGIVGKAFGGASPNGAIEKVSFGLTRMLGPKPWLIGGAAVAGVAALGAYLAMRPTGRKYQENDNQFAQIPPILTPADLPPLVPGLGGYANSASMNSAPDDPNMTRTRAVLASRGQTLDNPAQPTLDPSLNVQQLG